MEKQTTNTARQTSAKKNSKKSKKSRDPRWLPAKDGSSYYFINPHGFGGLKKAVAGDESLLAEVTKIGTGTRLHWSRAQRLIKAARKAGLPRDFRFLETEAARRSRYDRKHGKKKPASQRRRFKLMPPTLAELMKPADETGRKVKPTHAGSAAARNANRKLVKQMFSAA